MCKENEKATAGVAQKSKLSGSVPVRLCCGQRHRGAVCPDGKVMCCICFERVSQDDLRVLPDGKKEDVCKACDAMEKLQGPTRGVGWSYLLGGLLGEEEAE